ncbi:hypothetical protein [Saccharothrix obliqua]|uniref:hypothetical protein n=1 Tax=Saccharothrix obliqua TaxID=2861747 RepID=UPI001C5FC038|nr:hypothetical protein [Saccharothrix obliqua]MBW4721333.1 hypothetical protein [Saccharothrix obliqua]
MDDDTLRSSVSDLLGAFRDALIALVPIADRLKMGWRDGDQHRDWENMAEAVFNACVRGPIEADEGRWNDEYRLPRYDIDDSMYSTSSWIRLTADDRESLVVFVRLVSAGGPFDAVEGVELDPVTLVPRGRVVVGFEGCGFTFVRRSGARSEEVRGVVAVE